MKFKKRIEKWDKMLLEAYDILLKLHKEFNEIYKEFNKIEDAKTTE